MKKLFIIYVAFSLLTIAALTALLFKKDNIPKEVNTATAGYLNAICSQPKSDRDKFFCIGRINGFIAGWVASDAMDAATNTEANKRQMCPEQYIKDDSPALGIGVFLEWMKRHPEAENWDYIRALSSAFTQVFTCEQTNQD
ncbi:MAG: hypothetical protein H3C49_03660 [Alphaproteobacteria bacterium]|nr:hypothetical protein [Alphaproteobacteria bacterium]